MCHRLVPARYAVVAAAVALICSTHASAQRLSLPAKTTDDAPIVMLTGPDAGPAPRTPAGTRSLARRLTTQQKTAIVNRAYPNGLPKLSPVKATSDPTGLSKQVILGPALMFDDERTAALGLAGATYFAPMTFPGRIIVDAGAEFRIYYRPVMVGAPVMIECELESSATGSKLDIKPNQPTVVKAIEASVNGNEVLAFVVLPAVKQFNTVTLRVEKGRIQVLECAVTPLS